MRAYIRIEDNDKTIHELFGEVGDWTYSTKRLGIFDHAVHLSNCRIRKSTPARVIEWGPPGDPAAPWDPDRGKR